MSYVMRMALLGLAAPTSALAGSPSLAILNIAIVDVEQGVLRRDQTVLVQGERIARIGSSELVAVPEGAKAVDGSGRFLMPGLIDAHVHYISPETFGPMLVAHGVVLVRDTGGPTERVIALREQLAAGTLLGPEMLCTGAILDGDPPVWGFSEVCRNADEARAAVAKLAKAGVDQIKVYSRLNEDAYGAAVEEAHRLGLKVTGHIPSAISLSQAIDAGQDCIEHLEGFDELIATAAGHGDDSPPSFAAWAMYAEADQGQLRKAYRQMRRAGTTLCPTLVVMKGISRTVERDEREPWLAYVPRTMRSFWSNEGFLRSAPQAKATVPIMQSVVLDLHEAGVNLICGTDLANPYVFAGHSLHEEMRLFQEAGIPAAEVLRSATIRPSKFLGVDHRLGTIQEGKLASMVVVGDDPLTDIRNARHIEAVILIGRYFDHAQLDKMLHNARTYAKSTFGGDSD